MDSGKMKQTREDSHSENYNHQITQINTDKMKRAKAMPHFNIYRRERGIRGFVY